MARKLLRRNTKIIRVDPEIFLTELKLFEKERELEGRMSNTTREIGKELRKIRLKQEKESRREIKF